jgi:AcrR family transcriptional regulator
MRSSPDIQTRRRPRQARAQATVEAILDATAQVLVNEGYDRASTNRIALAAGVSIGSLYQYFSSKEALVSALVNDHVAKMMEAFQQEAEGAEALRLPEAVRCVIRAMGAAYRVNPALYHVLCQEVPKIGKLRRVYDFERQVARLNRQYLNSHKHELRKEDLSRACFVVLNSVAAVVRAAVAQEPEHDLDDRLLDELTDLCLRYLQRDRISQ